MEQATRSIAEVKKRIKKKTTQNRKKKILSSLLHAIAIELVDTNHFIMLLLPSIAIAIRRWPIIILF
jgi:hypothetical protein